MNPTSDGALVKASRSGDVDAFCVLVRRHRDAFARFAARMLGSVDDADDALQSAFMRAFRNLSACRDPERFRAWMYRIVINECRTLATRRAARERRLVRDEGVLASLVATVHDDGSVLRDEIQRAVDRLEPGQREAFLLKHVEELSYEEMVELTGVRTSALKMRVKRACERLREILEGAYDARTI
jgi:RNA polymerase sigma-70 factor (ECF subfamily)